MAGKAELILAALVTSCAPINYQILPDIASSDISLPSHYAVPRSGGHSSISNMNMDEFTARMEHLRDQLQQFESMPLLGLSETPPHPLNNAKIK